MKYQATSASVLGTEQDWIGPVRDTFAAAQTDGVVTMQGKRLWIVRAICPNCEQWRHPDPDRNRPWADCVNECAKRGFAPVAGPDTTSRTLWGYQVGAGAEFEIMRHLLSGPGGAGRASALWTGAGSVAAATGARTR